MYCPKCGAPNLANAQFCGHCGYSFVSNPSTQNIQAEQTAHEFASPLTRFFAYIIDTFIISILALIFFLITSPFSAKADSGDFLLTSITYFVFFLVVSGYSILMPAFFGATLGKMFLKIKIVGSSYQPAGYFKVLLRETIGKMVSGSILMIGFISIIFDSENKGWHDRIASTYVIKRKDKISFNKQIPIKTILLLVIYLIMSAFLSVGSALVIQYGIKGEASDKELSIKLQTFFDNDQNSYNDLLNIADIISKSLNITQRDVIELEKLSLQVSDVNKRLVNLSSDISQNLLLLDEVEKSLTVGNYYYDYYKRFFADIRDAQKLLGDTLNEYTQTWNVYQPSISNLIEVAKHDSRLIQLEKEYSGVESVASIKQIIDQNRAEYISISDKMGLAVDTLTKASDKSRFPQTLMLVLEAEKGLANAFQDMALADAGKTQAVVTSYKDYQKNVNFLASNDILAAYNAWLDIEVIPALSKYVNAFNRADAKLDSAYAYYNQNILRLTPQTNSNQQDSTYQDQYPEDINNPPI